MTPVFWMTTACLGSWALAAWLMPLHEAAVFFGMLGPLAAAAGTWLILARTARVNPAGITRVILSGFVVKALFFAGYIVMVLETIRADRTAFVVSFTGYFVLLYGTDALLLRRLSGRLT
jgi:hypothetical protein